MCFGRSQKLTGMKLQDCCNWPISIFFPESWYGMKYEWYETGQDVLSTVVTGGTLILNACCSHFILIKHKCFHLFSPEKPENTIASIIST